MKCIAAMIDRSLALLAVVLVFALASCSKEEVVVPGSADGTVSLRSMDGGPDDPNTTGGGATTGTEAGGGLGDGTDDGGGISDDGDDDGDSERNKKTKSR
ncbi:MAG: hypothetical protein JNL05_09610 [Flavobacteriales bacterium]|nr:hypothetical protein [Flavobacteriales bacterium]